MTSRNYNKVCCMCRFWQTDDEEHGSQYGECRRHAPMPLPALTPLETRAHMKQADMPGALTIPLRESTLGTSYSVARTYDGFWCGDYEEATT